MTEPDWRARRPRVMPIDIALRRLRELRARLAAASQPPPPPPESLTPQASPQPTVDFTTFVGSLGDLREVAGRWPEVAQAADLPDLAPPTVLPHPGEPEGEPRVDGGDVRVAALRHTAGDAPRLAARLREATARVIRADVRIDAGYWLAPSGVDDAPPTDWLMEWSPQRLPTLQHLAVVALPPQVVGAPGRSSWPLRRRVIVIDTGDARADEQHAFLTSAVHADEGGHDRHGHGTAIGDVIRLLAPGTHLTSARVFESDDRYASSAALLNGLTWSVARASGAHVVCIAQRALVDAADHGGALGTFAMCLRGAQHAGVDHPVVVTAAGNTTDGPVMDVPATVPGVVVAIATDWDGRPTGYNCQPPACLPIAAVNGYGGVAGDPIGRLRDGTGGHLELVGSSFAAAVVAASILDHRSDP